MSTSSPLGLSFGLNLPTLRLSLPYITASLGVLALLGGAMNFTNPIEGAKMFGITLSADSKPTSSPTATETAYIRIHGIRNIAAGLTNIALCAFYRFSTMTRTSPIAAEVVRTCIGISLLVGSGVAVGDGFVLNQFARDVEGTDMGEVGNYAQEKGSGHVLTGVPIAVLGLGWLLL